MVAEGLPPWERSPPAVVERIETASCGELSLARGSGSPSPTLGRVRSSARRRSRNVTDRIVTGDRPVLDGP
jgi:hypothetical protein